MAQEYNGIHIVDYKPAYQKAFHDLNEVWILQYFIMEPSDYKALDNPDEYIVQPGGHILIALENDIPIGTCALIKMKDSEYDFEMAKMGVATSAQGKGVGEMLGRAAIDKARQHGAKKIFLESNTVLATAIRLYKRLGFKQVTGKPTPYERCNIQMELVLDPAK